MAHPGERATPKAGRLAMGLVMVAIGAMIGAALWKAPLRAQYQTAPRFEGPSLPEPPEQARPWAAPASTLPGPIVDASRRLFDQGVADPRGCEYREVEVDDRSIVPTRAFVLPARPGEARRFAVGWDGVVYPASSVGKAADLDADVRGLADSLRKDREEAVAKGNDKYGYPGGFAGPTGRLILTNRTNASVESPSALKVCLLLRFGRADLAESLFAAGTGWKPVDGLGPAADRVNYQTLATEWANQAYNRAVDAHGRGDDVVALDAARRVSAFIKSAGPALEAMGFARPNQPRAIAGLEAPPFFPDLGQLPDLLADQARRAIELPRAPVPGPGAPARVRIAALIRELDQLTGSGFVWNGMTSPSGPTLGALVREGDAAVSPLLDVLESDDRLTRAVSHPGSRQVKDDRFVHYVHQSAYNALTMILKTRVIPGATGSINWDNDRAARKREAAAIRAYWAKNRGVTEEERYFRTLANDAATPAEWFDAAEALVQPADVKGRGGAYSIPPRPGGKVPPARGEPLRGRQSPSIANLMARRVVAIDPERPDEYNLHQVLEADRMAYFLADWDAKAASPTLRARVARLTRFPRGGQFRTSMAIQLAVDLAEFTLRRDQWGDPGALEDYAAWVGTLTPDDYGPLPPQVFEPIWRRPDHPAIARAADALFVDPASRWVAVLLLEPERPGIYFRAGLINSPLLGVKPFRDLVLRSLASPMEIGSVQVDAAGKANVNFPSGGGQYSPSPLDPLRPQPGTRMPIRLADEYANALQNIGGLAQFEYYWPEAKRDELIAATAAFLEQYGARIRDRRETRVPAESWEMNTSRRPARAVFSLDPLDHPAGPVDVRQGRAIFSLDPLERRLYPMPTLPAKARWTALEIADDDPGFGPSFGSPKRTRARVEALQEGLAWQAEEALEGGRWRRYYGFVGRHVRARVSAEEIEFPSGLGTGWQSISGEYEGRVSAPGDSDDARRFALREVKLAGPLMVEVWLRNRRGVDVPAPSGWARSEGGLSLVEGLAFRLFRIEDPPATARGPLPDPLPEEEIAARPVPHHRGGEPSGTLAPTETTRVLRLDLRDLFPIEEPGRYRLELTSDAFRAAEGRPDRLSYWFRLVPPAVGPGP